MANPASLFSSICVHFFPKPYYLGCGGLLFALPKLLVGSWTPYEITDEEFNRDICLLDSRNATLPSYCATGSITGARALHAVIFVTAQLIMGAGTAPIRTLGKVLHTRSLDFFYSYSVV